MASRITKKCTSCGDCLPICPTGSVYYGIGQYVVDSDSCQDCQVCVPICPEDAIIGQKPEPEPKSK